MGDGFSELNGMRKMMLGLGGSASGAASILGSWQVCHNSCLLLISTLSILGVSVAGMPLAFLTEFVIPIWTLALLFLLVMAFLYWKMACISRDLILFNSGLIVAGIPFKEVSQFQTVFWFLGGGMALVAIAMFLRERIWVDRI